MHVLQGFLYNICYDIAAKGDLEAVKEVDDFEIHLLQFLELLSPSFAISKTQVLDLSGTSYNISEIIESETGCTKPCEDNWVTT